jgi:transglutaminase-like putative cysteine protease
VNSLQPTPEEQFALYVRTTSIIDWKHPRVEALALSLGGGDPLSVARRCFEWVRDEIRHSVDYDCPANACAASEVLEIGAGLCYAKSHLLVALLRANSIPAGFCYQRLSLDGEGAPFCLHGLVAVHLPDVGWYRADPRGNKPGVDAQFRPPNERLAFHVRVEGEADLPEIWHDPLSCVVDVLRACDSPAGIIDRLPDVPLIRSAPGS